MAGNSPIFDSVGKCSPFVYKQRNQVTVDFLAFLKCIFLHRKSLSFPVRLARPDFQQCIFGLS